MFTAWRIRRLQVKLAGLEAREKALQRMSDVNDSIPWDYIDQFLNVKSDIARTKKRLEQLDVDAKATRSVPGAD